MKEKIGIEKLILLYYEYELDLLKRDMRGNGATEREIELADIEKVEEEELEKNLNKLSDLKPFIKWLVENDKIDLEKVYEKIGKPQIIMYEEWSKEEELCEIIGVNERDYYEDIIMLLSISSSPIEDLLLYLK